jgi:methionyl aminopeptidase
VLQKICEVAKEAFDAGLAKVKPGAKTSNLGKAVHNVAKRHGLTVIKNLTGHGVGRAIHEAPDHIFNYYSRWDDEILKEGMVIAFEPFISTFEEEVFQVEDDDWTFFTEEKHGRPIRTYDYCDEGRSDRYHVVRQSKHKSAEVDFKVT